MHFDLSIKDHVNRIFGSFNLDLELYWKVGAIRISSWKYLRMLLKREHPQRSFRIFRIFLENSSPYVLGIR